MKKYHNDPENDTEICRLLKSDGIAGMELMFNVYYSRLVLWANTIIGDPGEAEDIVQGYFVSLWAKDIYKSLRPETLRSFLFTSVRNLSLNLLSREKTRLKKSWDPTLLHVSMDDFGPIPESVYEIVRQEVENLPGRSREVVSAVFVEGQKYGEVATRYGISLSTVKTIVHRAISALRNRLSSIDFENQM